MLIKNKHKIIFALLVFGAVFLVIGHIAFAQFDGGSVPQGSYDNIGAEGAAKLTDEITNKPFFLLVWVVNICAAIVSLLGWLINFAIFAGKSVMVLPIVQVGSQAMINFANLGFVFAIIVIAFATIFRVQGYQMKQILWKLVVAALLVNFSLTIAGAFISVANIFTDFFLQQMTQSNIADGFMGILNPQSFIQVTKDTSILEKLLSPINSVIKIMTSLLFVIIFSFIVILTFLAMSIMLLIRTVMLGLLLVLMPIVWLLWIFPGTQKYWAEWWSNFIRWTFFAPIMLFFIVLVISGGSELEKIREKSGMAAQQQTPAMEKAFNNNFTLDPNFFDRVAQLVITTGLLLGGLIAANKMGITFASTAMGMAKGGGKMFGGWAGRKGLQYGSGLLRKPRGEEGEKKSIAQRLSDWSSGSKLAKYTILPGLAARGVAKFAAAGGENLVKNAKNEAGKRSMNENIAMLGYASEPVKQGILQYLQEKKSLDKVPNVKDYINQGQKNRFANFGQQGAFEDIEKSLGMNVKMKESLDKGTDESMKEFYEEGKKFFSSFSNDDWKKIQMDKIFSDPAKPKFGLDEKSQERLQKGIAHSIVASNPGNTVKILNNVKPQNFNRARNAIKDSIPKLEQEDPKLAKGVSDALKKTMAKRLMGESLEFPSLKEEGDKEEVDLNKEQT